jgi:hypothetical protein
MKKLTKKQQEEFIEKCDMELVEDLVMSFDYEPESLTWDIFYPRYQKMHVEKYGGKLTI